MYVGSPFFMGNLFLGALYIHDETYINTGFFSIQGEIFKGTISLWVEKVDLHLRIGLGIPYYIYIWNTKLSNIFWSAIKWHSHDSTRAKEWRLVKRLVIFFFYFFLSGKFHEKFVRKISCRKHASAWPCSVLLGSA